jgi:hypothetical protein
VGDTYDYSSVTPTEAANASALVALEAAEEIEERQKDSVIGNLKFFFKDLEVGINQIRSGDGERTSSRSFLQSD